MGDAFILDQPGQSMQRKRLPRGQENGRCHRVCAAMAAAPEGWAIDGNYDLKLAGMVVGVADTIVWLDLPLGIRLR